MAVSAAVEKEPFGSRNTAQGMPAMALETEERHGCVEQMPVDRPMGGMAVGAVLGNIAMLEQEWPLLLHMAPGTHLLRGTAQQQFILR
jgi:hypothetical protein